MLSATSSNAADYTINQTDKQFSEKTLYIKVGDSVNFVNNDPFFHNVYSLSETRQFDLGFYRTGLGKSVTFDKAGKVEVECAIHPNMKFNCMRI